MEANFAFSVVGTAHLQDNGVHVPYVNPGRWQRPPLYFHLVFLQSPRRYLNSCLLSQPPNRTKKKELDPSVHQQNSEKIINGGTKRRFDPLFQRTGCAPASLRVGYLGGQGSAPPHPAGPSRQCQGGKGRTGKRRSLTSDPSFSNEAAFFERNYERISLFARREGSPVLIVNFLVTHEFDVRKNTHYFEKALGISGNDETSLSLLYCCALFIETTMSDTYVAIMLLFPNQRFFLSREFHIIPLPPRSISENYLKK